MKSKILQIDFGNALKTIEHLLNTAIALLPKIFVACVIIIVASLIAGWCESSIRKLTRRRRHISAGIILGQLARWSVYIIAFLVSLSVVVPSFKASDLIQTLGLGGIAIGFAFKDVFQNFLSGLILLISEPFQVDDDIQVAGMEGTVVDVGTRATSIRKADGAIIYMPNSLIFTSPVTVIKQQSAPNDARHVDPIAAERRLRA